MQLTTLVDILENEIPGTSKRASTRSKLGELYAERGCHDDAVTEFRGARRALRKEGKAGSTAALDATVALITSLAGAGRLEEAKREAKRVLSAGDVPPPVSAQLERIVSSPSRRHAR